MILNSRTSHNTNNYSLQKKYIVIEPNQIKKYKICRSQIERWHMILIALKICGQYGLQSTTLS